jgi:cytochrome c oxidase cbb3-type subunit 3
MLTESSARQQAEKAGIPYAPSQSWWQILMHKLTRSTPVEQEADILLDHSYDGIRELDNYLPPWWKWLFYGTVVWAVIYLIVYHVAGLLPLSNEEYMAEVEEVQKIRASQEIVQIDENTLEFTAEADLINKGKEVFISNCASCHRNDGGGSVGPNLTDEYWLHGGSVRNIYATIKNGVPEKGMISWAPILKPEEIRDAAFYIMSIQGTNPPGSKAPQGELHVPEPAKVNADSVVAETNL